MHYWYIDFAKTVNMVSEIAIRKLIHTIIIGVNITTQHYPCFPEKIYGTFLFEILDIRI